MTDFSDLLLPQTILNAASAGNKKILFQQVAAAIAAAHGLEATAIVDALIDRERRGSTGFGGGIAIPHARLGGIGSVIGCFARLAHPIDFQSVDDLPVDLVFVLLSPVEAGAAHLKALARVSRGLRDSVLAAKLRGAGSTDALFALLAADETRDAA